MRRFRFNVLLIAAGLLLFNLGNFAFANATGFPAASYAATQPVDGEDTDDAGASLTVCVPSARREAVVLRQESTQPVAPTARPAFPSPITRHASLSWQFVQRAAAAPRAPASRA